MANDLGELRRTAVVSTFGPGAIIDFRAGDASVSAVAAGLEQWDLHAGPSGITNPQTIFEPRLQKRLGVSGFRLPPVDPDRDRPRRPGQPAGPVLTAARFPDWLQCPACHVIQYSSHWNSSPGKASRTCGACAAKLGGGEVHTLPVRFVTACVRGHLDEFPWHFWVGHDAKCEASPVGPLLLTSEGAGLAGLKLRCESCGAARTMDGIFSKGALKAGTCRGKRPWLGDEEPCTETPRVVQRGASNLYFPVIVSALNIPPWSDWLQRALGQYWDPIVSAADADREGVIRVLHGYLGVSLSPEQLAKAIAAKLARIAVTDVTDLRRDEYLQFVSQEADREKDEFEIRQSAIPDGFEAHVDSVIRAVRLREVRALSAFTRIHPPSDVDESKYARISTKRLNWLPAVEVRGEGIFLTLSEERLKAWEAMPTVSARAVEIDRRFHEEWSQRHDDGSKPSRHVSARFLLLHTLAHVLIRELALDCGYSSASLRERLYVGHGDTAMAGLLIYTASSDSDGTLGGLVRQGQPERLGKTFQRALGASVWCSSDPLCSRGLMSPPENMSGAACHACVLVAETSCEEFNRFLDRNFLIDPEYGFFREVTASLR